jgi:hypothetical protein
LSVFPNSHFAFTTLFRSLTAFGMTASEDEDEDEDDDEDEGIAVPPTTIPKIP